MSACEEGKIAQLRPMQQTSGARMMGGGWLCRLPVQPIANRGRQSLAGVPNSLEAEAWNPSVDAAAKATKKAAINRGFFDLKRERVTQARPACFMTSAA
jgi:hypothetical protein